MVSTTPYIKQEGYEGLEVKDLRIGQARPTREYGALVQFELLVRRSSSPEVAGQATNAATAN